MCENTVTYTVSLSWWRNNSPLSWNVCEERYGVKAGVEKLWHRHMCDKTLRIWCKIGEGKGRGENNNYFIVEVVTKEHTK